MFRAQDQRGRDDFVLQDLLVAVDIADKKVQSRDALDQPGLDLLPFISGNDARNEIEGENPFGSLVVIVDGERHAPAKEGQFHGGPPVLKILRRLLQESPGQKPVMRADVGPVSGEHFIEERFGFVRGRQDAHKFLRKRVRLAVSKSHAGEVTSCRQSRIGPSSRAIHIGRKTARTPRCQGFEIAGSRTELRPGFAFRRRLGARLRILPPDQPERLFRREETPLAGRDVEREVADGKPLQFQHLQRRAEFLVLQPAEKPPGCAVFPFVERDAQRDFRPTPPKGSADLARHRPSGVSTPRKAAATCPDVTFPRTQIS